MTRKTVTEAGAATRSEPLPTRPAHAHLIDEREPRPHRRPVAVRQGRASDLLAGTVIGAARLTGCHKDAEGFPPYTDTELTQPRA